MEYSFSRNNGKNLMFFIALRRERPARSGAGYYGTRMRVVGKSAEKMKLVQCGASKLAGPETERML